MDDTTIRASRKRSRTAGRERIAARRLDALIEVVAAPEPAGIVRYLRAVADLSGALRAQ